MPYRIQSRRVFFFKNFLRLEKGMFEVTPDKAERRTITDNLDIVTELTRLAVDLDTVVEELLKVGAVEDTVSSGLRVVNDKFKFLAGGSGGGLGGLIKRKRALAY
ncbi:hypothetical protein CVT26_010041 [Gymnopilus dilepis]|uniref:Uncharacterized protein n=1 Tax=Gymnopilus dilepis TaxID=231916 RepID=A0A409Y724_9AGAR|nr:hypothetical protein CVT26_010041 [Gymnopilus dilepis]